MEYLRTNRYNSGPQIYLHLMYDTVYFKPPFGITGPCTLLVNAQYKDTGLRDKCDTLPLYILSTPSEDTVPPVITIKCPSYSNTRIQSLPLIIQIACSDENGIDSIQCVFRGEKCTVSKSHDSLYSVEITTLTAGKRDTIHFTVTDSSTNHNAATFQVIINYNRPPLTISISSPAINATGVTRSPTFTWSGRVDPDEDSVFYRVLYGTTAEALTSQTAVFKASPVTVPSTTVLEPKSENGEFFYLTNFGAWWLSGEWSPTEGCYFGTYSTYTGFDSYCGWGKKKGTSIRCIRDY